MAEYMEIIVNARSPPGLPPHWAGLEEGVARATILKGRHCRLPYVDYYGCHDAAHAGHASAHANWDHWVGIAEPA